jgi:uncharacterized damage-inducible protein DinB
LGNEEVALMDFQNDLLAEYERETAKTRKMLEAIPADADLSYKPHEKSMSLGRLAGHLTDFAGDWALTVLTKDKLDLGTGDFKPFVPASKAEALEKFDKELGATRAALAATTGDAWDRNWQLVWQGQVVINEPKHGVFREAVLSHMIHHRAQLGVYLRLLDAKIPGTYGPSADGM